METPILDFLRGYAKRDMSRLHMPGHKGVGPLGCESWDITEVEGADALYEAEGIIARSEANAARLFGSGRTLYSTEGSSQCIRAMLTLAFQSRPAESAPVVLAGRNAHKSFLYAAALLDVEVEWLWSEEPAGLCSCRITGAGLERRLAELERPPFAVYVTSPDYLGQELNISDLARVCERHGVPLLVDNAHGAYLHFLKDPRHPLDLGTDMCCDSAHKTLPVLTGGAYLHISGTAPKAMLEGAKRAMALYGSTSPSYLTLASLDACNAWLAGEGGEKIKTVARAVEELRARLEERGWKLNTGDPLKLALDVGSRGWTGPELARLFREGGVEPEFADPDHVVLMASGSTTGEELRQVERILSAAGEGGSVPRTLPQAGLAAGRPKRILPIRQAMFAPQEELPVEKCLGRVCAAPTVSCPPAVPILVCGEQVDQGAIECFQYYGVSHCAVVK